MATRLEIVTAERVLFEGDVDAVVAPGGEGQLGVLPHHAAVMTTLQPGELRYRVGGEEFLAICGNSDLKNATAGADRIRAALEEHEMQFTSFRGHITASLGVAQKLEGMSGVDDLLKAADEMAYVCKAEGRNCVRGWHGPWRQSRSA